MKLGEMGVGANGLHKTQSIIFKLIWNQRVLFAQSQETYSSYYSTSYKLRFFHPHGLTEFYKVDNNAKVNGQKLNELDAMKACFVQLLLFLWRDNDFDIYRDRFVVTFSQRPESL